MDTGTVAAGYVSFALDAIVAHYGLAREELLDACGLDTADLRDPGATLPGAALWDLFRFTREQTQDPALGLRLARTIDLRLHGFWGYALLSALTLRQRIDIHVRYQRLRSSSELEFRVEDDVAITEVRLHDVPSDVEGMFLDWSFATACIQLHRHVGKQAEVSLWLSCPEAEHHQELRALVGGPIVFNAPCNRLQYPARLLDLKLPGDPHLSQLATSQLDAQLSQVADTRQRNLLDQVRGRLGNRLSADVSIDRVARELRVSARTLRRQLAALGSSFQSVLEEVRRTRAIQYILHTREPVEWIAAHLGYADASSFRRAFRRWTGSAPSRFRDAGRTLDPQLSSPNDRV